jgi:hypothetical protein
LGDGDGPSPQQVDAPEQQRHTDDLADRHQQADRQLIQQIAVGHPTGHPDRHGHDARRLQPQQHGCANGRTQTHVDPRP